MSVCCCRLQIGAYIIGAIELLVSLTSAMFWIYFLAEHGHFTADGRGDHEVVAFLVVSVVNIIFASLLLAGTYKRCHKLVLAWVVMDGVVLGACTIAHLIFSIFVGIMLLPLVLIPLIFILLKCYTWLVTFKFYQEVKKEYEANSTSLYAKFNNLTESCRTDRVA